MLLLLGCPVPLDWADVDPPRAGGLDALAVEDFERDLWLLSRPDAEEALRGRWLDMGLELGDRCGVRRGEPREGAGAVLVQASDVPTTAMAISLAKTLDGSVPPRDVWFCPEGAAPPEAVQATLSLQAPSSAATELLDATRGAWTELQVLLGY